VPRLRTHGPRCVTLDPGVEKVETCLSPEFGREITAQNPAWAHELPERGPGLGCSLDVLGACAPAASLPVCLREGRLPVWRKRALDPRTP
jgi:hypothetical protein